MYGFAIVIGWPLPSFHVSARSFRWETKLDGQLCGVLAQSEKKSPPRNHQTSITALLVSNSRLHVRNETSKFLVLWWARDIRRHRVEMLMPKYRRASKKEQGTSGAVGEVLDCLVERYGAGSKYNHFRTPGWITKGTNLCRYKGGHSFSFWWINNA